MTNESTVCAVCGGSRTASTTTFTVDLNSSLLVVRHVPALVCRQCGEEWIADSEAARLEEMVQDAQNRHAAFEVMEWGEPVAA